jgi:hypothetical protein
MEPPVDTLAQSHPPMCYRAVLDGLIYDDPKPPLDSPYDLPSLSAHIIE